MEAKGYHSMEFGALVVIYFRMFRKEVFIPDFWNIRVLSAIYCAIIVDLILYNILRNTKEI